MKTEKITINDLVQAIGGGTTHSKGQIEQFVKSLFTLIEEGLVRDGVVKVAGLGTFKMQSIEARKSVDVNTGEEILIEGYNKVSFTPETTLKEKVNEPFAHLETTIIEEGNTPISSASESVLSREEESKRKFEVQAAEIQGLLSEINAPLAPTTSEVVEPVSAPIPEPPIQSVEPTSKKEIQASVVQQPQRVEERKEKITITKLDKKYMKKGMPISPAERREMERRANQAHNAQSEKNELTPSVNSPAAPMVERKSDPVVPPKKEVKKSEPKKEVKKATEKTDTNKQWKIIGLVVCAVCLLIVLWFVFMGGPKKEVVGPTPTTTSQSASDSSAKIEEVSIFDRPRVYKEFLGTERLPEGSRLAQLAREYYGSPFFWVYIYEANRETIDDPNYIQARTPIRIPKLPAELIDLNNPECEAYALKLKKLYVK